jgi:hypothetical protein
MANICSVDFSLRFKNESSRFVNEFKQQLGEAEKRHEGVKLATDTWLFDVIIENDDTIDVKISGWVKWALTHEAIRGFVERLSKQGLKSLECQYEESSNLIFGKYEYSDDELLDTFIPASSAVWENGYEEDDYFELLEEALETEGETVTIG